MRTRLSILALAALAALTLTACVIPPHAILRDPRTGQTVNCTYMSEVDSGPSYRGVGGAIGAGAADGVASAFKERACINSYMGAGFQCIQGICQ